MRRAQLLFTLLAMLGLVVSMAPPAMAGEPQVEVLARGLNAPRHLNFGADGAPYVAEAGRGGTTCVGPAEEQLCYGRTGSIIKFAGSSWSRVLRNLPSAAMGIDVFGVHDVTATYASGTSQQGAGITMWVLTGGAPGLRQVTGDRRWNRLLRVEPGIQRSVADFERYETQRNPDGTDINPNAYALVTLPGRHVVADAGGNTLLQVKMDGTISTLAVFPSRTVAGPGGQPVPMHSVPTSLAYGPDRAYYVGELTGFPFPYHGARVYRKAIGDQPTVYRRGFTNIIDIDFGPDGSLYVLELMEQGLLNANPEDPATLAGRLVRVRPNGVRSVISTGGHPLVTPTGIEVGQDGSIYVSNYGLLPGMGEVIRIRP